MDSKGFFLHENLTKSTLNKKQNINFLNEGTTVFMLSNTSNIKFLKLICNRTLIFAKI